MSGMIDQQYKTRHHELPLVRAGARAVVYVTEASDWFRRSVQPHLKVNVPVRIDAAPGYAYALQPREFDRVPVLARRLILRWYGGRLFLDAARGVDGQPVDLNSLLSRPTLEEAAEAALSHPAQDTALSKSGLHPTVQTKLADTARQEAALRRELLAQVLAGDAAARCLCVKLLGKSFDGCDPNGDLYQQAAAKFETVPYAPHLRDLTAQLINGPLPSAVRDAAVNFCRHLNEIGIEPSWAAELLTRA
jgi:hypothetical protein